jgi:hypothetical protein
MAYIFLARLAIAVAIIFSPTARSWLSCGFGCRPAEIRNIVLFFAMSTTMGTHKKSLVFPSNSIGIGGGGVRHPMKGF